MEIKILVPGCARCEQVEKVIREALTETGVEATYGVFGTPAAVIDGEVKSVGKIPKEEDIINWIGPHT